MGAVYRAEHPLLGKTAAVKVLLPELSNNHDIVNRFFTEARSATAVRHPGIVEIYDFGYLPSGAAYLVMELLDGESLSTVLVSRGRLTEQEALVYTRGISSALVAAHAQGIVHRDLKPDNIFLVRDPDMVGGLRPKILDFGIAKVAEAQRIGGASSKTRTGTVMGTPTYMSPEQCRGVGEIDDRSDLYSVGCILYEMLVGRPPFSSEGIGEILAMHQFMAPTKPTEAGVVVSAAAERLVLQLLQKRPEDRVQSAAELTRLLGHGSMPVITHPGAPTMISGGTGGRATTTRSAATGAGPTGAGLAGPPRRSSRGSLFAGIGVVLAGGVVTVIILSGDGRSSLSSAAASLHTPSASIDAGVAVVVAPSLVDATEVALPSAVTPPIDAAPAIDATPGVDATPAVDAPTGRGKRNTTPRGNKTNDQSTQGLDSSSVDRGVDRDD
jgi:serine/threonine-protein kinase